MGHVPLQLSFVSLPPMGSGENGELKGNRWGRPGVFASHRLLEEAWRGWCGEQMRSLETLLRVGEHPKATLRMFLPTGLCCPSTVRRDCLKAGWYTEPPAHTWECIPAGQNKQHPARWAVTPPSSACPTYYGSPEKLEK